MSKRSIRSVVDAPTVYLLDEWHDCDPSTDENIAEANRLLKQGAVLIGVEGFEGGSKYDDYEDRYVDEWVSTECSEETRIGAYPRFANALRSAGNPVVGIDCRGLANRVEIDEAEVTWSALRDGEHPNHKRRSDHFIRTIYKELLDRSLKGDVIVNAGSNHNQHVEDALVSGTLPPGWPDWNYVRYRSPSFSTCA